MRRLLKMALLSAVFMVFAAQPGHTADTKTNQAAPNPGDEVILRVNGKDFTRDNLSIAVNNLMPSMSFHTSVSAEKMKQIQKSALDTMINRELFYENAKSLKMTSVNEKDVDVEVENLKKRLKPGQTLEGVLKNSKMTIGDLRDDFKKAAVIKSFTAKKTEEFKKKAAENVNEAFMKDYYQKNLDKFREPEQIHLRSILIKADPAGGQKVWNESLKKAKDVTKRARGGEDFAKIAEKLSEDPYAKSGGDMGWTHLGSLFQEIDDAAVKMKPGEVSDPIMTIYGYHVIKLEGKRPSVLKKFEDLNREKLKSELEAKEFKRLWDDWIKSLRGASKIEYLAQDVKELAK